MGEVEDFILQAQNEAEAVRKGSLRLHEAVSSPSTQLVADAVVRFTKAFKSAVEEEVDRLADGLAESFANLDVGIQELLDALGTSSTGLNSLKDAHSQVWKASLSPSYPLVKRILRNYCDWAGSTRWKASLYQRLRKGAINCSGRMQFGGLFGKFSLGLKEILLINGRVNWIEVERTTFTP
mgnify:CR=1 FL=1